MLKDIIFVLVEQSTWLRLKHLAILHDAVPHPVDRVGHPMHIKVS